MSSQQRIDANRRVAQNASARAARSKIMNFAKQSQFFLKLKKPRHL